MNTLPNGKRVSRVGFGCSSLWAKPSFGDQEAQAVLEACVETGINHFDTGPSYGVAEHRLGRFLSGKSRAEFVVSTKVGTAPGGAKDFTPRGMEASLTGSLATLGLEQVDLLYLHGGSHEQLRDETFRFFEAEKARGRIVYSGLNSFDPAVIVKAITAPIDAVMLQYNVSDLSTSELLDPLHEAGKIIIGATPLAQGITNTRTFLPTTSGKAWYLLRSLRKDPAFLLRGAKLRKTLAAHGLTSSADPIRFVASDRRFTSAVFGTTNTAHVRENAATASRPLSTDQLASLQAALR